jgi:hypothetical protein
MGNETLAPQPTLLPHERLRVVVFVFLVAIVILWARFYFANLRVTDDPRSESDLTAAADQAQPLLDALERYRADNGLYPTTLNQLSPAYLPSLQGLHAFRYSARHSDWVFQSDACLAREQNLEGWVLKEVKEHQNEVAQFKRDCISGYRDFQLQSPDFPPDSQSRYLERWAYYDSQPQHWTLGWCEPVLESKGSPSELATNGVCRGRHHGASDPLSDPW